MSGGPSVDGSERGKERLRVAILGARCLPATYGGTETFTEVLATGLVARGHEVTVYCCSPYQEDRSLNYKGIRRVIVPTIRLASMEKFVYAALSFLHVSASSADVILMNQVGGGPFCVVPRIFGKKVVINPDGLDWKRTRWGWVGSTVLKLFERISAVGASCIAADSQAIAEYTWKNYKRRAVYIPYGANPAQFAAADPLDMEGLRPNEYIVQICRMEPENNAHLVIREFEQVKTGMGLAIVGGSPYSHKYGEVLRSTKDARIRLLGGIYGARYRALMKNAFVYIHGHEVGGTNPVLLDAMAAGQCIIALDVPFNREVLADAGLYFTKTDGDLSSKVRYILEHPEERDLYGEKAKQRVKEMFPWSRTISEHEALFFKLVHKTTEGLDG